MSRKHCLLRGALVAALVCPVGPVAWGAERAKVAATKKRVAKPAIPTPRRNIPATHDVAIPEGVRLLLSTTLREPPRGPFVVAPIAPAPVVAIVATPAASSPYQPRETPALVPRAMNPYLSASFPTGPGEPGVRAPLARPTYSPIAVPAAVAAAGNPYLPRPTPIVAAERPAAVAATPQVAPSSLFSSLALSIPLLPDSGQSILPKVSKVYPTGEKPLVVVSFKCPTEVVGITPPTIKLLHEAVNLGMAGINKTDLLSFDLQQVCQ